MRSLEEMCGVQGAVGREELLYLSCVREEVLVTRICKVKCGLDGGFKRFTCLDGQLNFLFCQLQLMERKGKESKVK